MRDLLLLGIVLFTLPLALRHTWIGVLLWTWLSLMNPHKLVYGFTYGQPFAAVTAGVVLVSLLTTRDKLRMPWCPPVVVLFLFVIWMCLTTIFAFYPAESWIQLSKVLKIQLLTGIALLALHERKHIEMFVWVSALSIGYFGLKGGIFTIIHGGTYRIWGPEGSFIEDNNHLAVAIIMAIPLLNYLRMVATRRSVRLGLLVLMPLCGASALGSHSRGGLLAIAAMSMLFWYRSPRRLVVGLVMAVVASALLALMPSSWDQRMGTIQTYEADESAMTRLWAWQTAINVANDRPLGGGFDLYTPLVHSLFAPAQQAVVRAAHSIYFAVLGEHGYFGLFLFLGIWLLTFRMAGAARKEAGTRPDARWVYQLLGMCQVSLLGYMVGGAFLSLAYFDLPYNILVIVVVARRWLRESASKQETGDASGVANPSATSPSPMTTLRAPT